MSYLQLVYEAVPAQENNPSAPLVELVPVLKTIKYFEDATQADAYHQELVNRKAIAVWFVRAPEGWFAMTLEDISAVALYLED